MTELLNEITQGDAIENMRKLADDSVDLIVIDPPYNIGKDKRWDKWKTVDAYVEFMGEVFTECERVLKPTGSFYWFHNDMTQVRKLMDYIDGNTQFAYKQFIVWNKRYEGSPRKYYFDNVIKTTADRNYRSLAEYCLYYTLQDGSGLSKVMGGYENFAPLKAYFNTEQTRIERDLGVKVKERVKWTTHFHWFAQGLSWGMCPPWRYEELKKAFPGYFQKPYEELRKQYEELRKQYDAERYTFNNLRTHHSVWNYEVAPKQGHITPKPADLIENIIRHSSNEGDVVLDCFGGSGTTAVAAVNTGRNYVLIEREPEYCEIARKRVTDALQAK